MYFNNFLVVIYIGRGVYIVFNVGIIIVNYNIKNLKLYVLGEDVKIGNYSWIGMNLVILLGVELGEYIIVGVGLVVIKSFLEGNVVIGGNLVKVIKKIWG